MGFAKGKKNRASVSKKSRGPRPRRAVKALKRQNVLFKIAQENGAKIVGGGAVGLAVTGVALVAKGHAVPGIVFTGSSLVITYFKKPLQYVGEKSFERFIAGIIGRPALAKRISKGKKRLETRAIMTVANLPFMTKGEMKQFCRHNKLMERNLVNFKDFRCFSTKELKAFRSEKNSVKSKKMFEEILEQKSEITSIAIEEPELTSLAFREIFKSMGINGTSRNLAKSLVEGIIIRHSKKAEADIVVNNKKTGGIKSIKIVFFSEKDRHWGMHKTVEDIKPEKK